MLKNAKKASQSAVNVLATRQHTFTCSAELLRAFEKRAAEQGCSVDWLLEEAMQRLLAEEVTARKTERPTAPPPVSESVSRTRKISTPLPLPPNALPANVAPPPRAERSAPVTVVQDAPAPLVLEANGERFVIDREPFIIGRSPNAANLVIDDGLVSRRHAAIERQTDGWTVTDLGSTNGLIVNGESVRFALLRPGVVLTVGPLTFVVISS